MDITYKITLRSLTSGVVIGEPKNETFEIEQSHHGVCSKTIWVPMQKWKQYGFARLWPSGSCFKMGLADQCLNHGYWVLIPVKVLINLVQKQTFLAAKLYMIALFQTHYCFYSNNTFFGTCPAESPHKQILQMCYCRYVKCSPRRRISSIYSAGSFHCRFFISVRNGGVTVALYHTTVILTYLYYSLVTYGKEMLDVGVVQRGDAVGVFCRIRNGSHTAVGGRILSH